MSTSRIVTNDEFKQMISYREVATTTAKKKAIKRKLKAKIVKSYGDRYYNLRQGTKDVIDMMCWLSAERGFVFASAAYLSKRYGISERTIRKVVKELQEQGLIVTTYRKSTTQNGRGCPVHLFVEHEYFTYWTSFLNLKFQSKFQADCEETPTESKDESKKNGSTYNLPLNSYIKNIRKQEPSMDASFVPANVPNEFVKTASPYFSAKKIYFLWGKVLFSHKLSGISQPAEDFGSVATQALKETIFAYKHRQIKKNIEGYFFGTLRNVFAAEQRKLAFANGKVPFYNWLEA